MLACMQASPSACGTRAKAAQPNAEHGASILETFNNFYLWLFWSFEACLQFASQPSGRRPVSEALRRAHAAESRKTDLVKAEVRRCQFDVPTIVSTAGWRCPCRKSLVAVPRAKLDDALPLQGEVDRHMPAYALMDLERVDWVEG